jgi:hypothetical protein
MDTWPAPGLAGVGRFRSESRYTNSGSGEVAHERLPVDSQEIRDGSGVDGPEVRRDVELVFDDQPSPEVRVVAVDAARAPLTLPHSGAR